MLDYYNILQIEKDASQDEVRQAYHKMARLFHPDNFNGSQEEASKQMAKINEAYQTLSDIDKRAVYDADRQLDDWEPEYNNKRHSRYEENNTFSANADNLHDSKAGHMNVENPTKKNPDKSSPKGCSSCMAKILEWMIYIAILYFVISHFHLVDQAKGWLNTFSIPKYGSEEKVTNKLIGLKPEEVVEQYFRYLKDGENVEADNLFSANADENFQTCTVTEYNKVIVDLYYGFEKDIPTYPLFEEIRSFDYKVGDAEVDVKEGYAEVNIEIENCDIALLFGMLLEADSDENILETLSDSEFQELFRNAIEEYKASCMISTNAIITLSRNQEGYWKIDSISPLKDFSTVIVGQADDLILIINGEKVDDDTLYENDYDEEDSEMLW